MLTMTARRFRLPVISGAAMLALAIAAPNAVADAPGENSVREQLGEIGAWAAPSKEKPPVGTSQQTILREKLGEIGAWALPSTSKESPLRSEKLDGLNLSAPTTSIARRKGDGFEWGDAAIGAGLAAALCATAAAVVGVRRRMTPAQ